MKKAVVEKLTTLLNNYGDNKKESDALKKVIDLQNAQIKEIMDSEKLHNFDTDSYSAKYSITRKETFNEEALIQVLKEAGVKSVIKKREYVDFDALENAIYHEKIDSDTLLKMNGCKEEKLIPTLRIKTRGDK